MAIRQGAVEDLAMSAAAAFWQGRRVLLTGHTGFKGAWTALWLQALGAKVTGFALAPPADRDCLYTCLAPWDGVTSILADLNDRAAIADAVAASDPEIVIHMAAQALVRKSFRTPLETFATNIMGTANLLAACTSRDALKAILVITSDKVYENSGKAGAFREDDRLAGDDPYSASKAAAELVVRSWRNSFLRSPAAPALATARAGNVIGGGDWAEDRLVPDVIRAGDTGLPVVLRYPDSVRPWQHVLDVVAGYLKYAERLASIPRETPTALNFGPQQTGITTREVVETLQRQFGWTSGWHTIGAPAVPEKSSISLASTDAAKVLDWHTRYAVADALALVARWHTAHQHGADMRAFSLQQIADYTALAEKA